MTIRERQSSGWIFTSGLFIGGGTVVLFSWPYVPHPALIGFAITSGIIGTFCMRRGIKILAVMLATVVLLNCTTISGTRIRNETLRRFIGEFSKGFSTPEVQAQAGDTYAWGELGYFLFKYFYYIVEAYGLYEFFTGPFYYLWSITFPGRPAVGHDSATDCDRLFMAPSPNPLCKELAGFWLGMENAQVPISTSNPYLLSLYIGAAKNFCTDMEKQFGARIGYQFCQEYLYLMLTSNPCTNRAAINVRKLLDFAYLSAVAHHKINHQTGFPY